MSHKRDLLIEIGTEELPPKALKKLSDAFSAAISEGLEKAELHHAKLHSYCSPRRLAVVIEKLDEAQKDRTVEKRGPALTAAFDGDGNPTKATEGFARSCGVTVDQLETSETDKGAWLVYRSEQKGATTGALIPDIVRAALDKLPIPKRMRWGDLTSEFVRPVHWVVLLFGNEVIDTEILSVRSGRETRGHRFHHPAPIYIGEPAAYAPLLESEGRVIVDFAKRREAIRGLVMEAAAKTGGTAVIDEELLDEVTGLVEWPVPIVGSFETRFLEVPAEALISTMKANQKYFHLVDGKGKLMPNFITLSNIDSADPSHVRAGNERVVRPRLTDADFFWNQDRKQPLAARLESLKSVVFQQKLGTLHDKSVRVSKLAAHIATQIGGDATHAERAAMLAKCDLMTAMVGEFPELQGIMGRYYATHDKEPGDVAIALDEQYMPRFAGDQLPASKSGQALAIAEKLDTLVGIFGIGQIPTGDKDPFALRRAALGALRIIIETGLDLDLEALLKASASTMPGIANADEVVAQVFDFMMSRLRAYYQDAGISIDTFEAVLAQRPTKPKDFNARIHAVTAFRALPEAAALASANKRIANILKKSDETIPSAVDLGALIEPAEKSLASAVTAMSSNVAPLFARREYESALKQLASLRPTVDAFFDAVMVNAEEKKLRLNRLALLRQLSALFLEVADLSQLQG